MRPLLPAGALIGVSTHTAAECAASTADFAFFGPVFATQSKAAFGAPQGIERLRAATAGAWVPVLAIGGVTPAERPAVRAAGAAGVAVIRAVLAAPGSERRDARPALGRLSTIRRLTNMVSSDIRCVCVERAPLS